MAQKFVVIPWSTHYAIEEEAKHDVRTFDDSTSAEASASKDDEIFVCNDRSIGEVEHAYKTLRDDYLSALGELPSNQSVSDAEKLNAILTLEAAHLRSSEIHSSENERKK